MGDDNEAHNKYSQCRDDKPDHLYFLQLLEPPDGGSVNQHTH
jgi:hypothetical protein